MAVPVAALVLGPVLEPRHEAYQLLDRLLVHLPALLRRRQLRLAQDAGEPDELRELSPAEVRARCASPAFRGGAFMREGASVQPALLARGLRRVVLERGVEIHEGPDVEVGVVEGAERGGEFVNCHFSFFLCARPSYASGCQYCSGGIWSLP